ncbi:MAG TPA: adenylate/guanylate cyclase domain-containing protein [Ktedonobacterales bacterium]|nr:adenylate/guanylate cyclase domain-containing protein [Ktedonobacterales bacterium]
MRCLVCGTQNPAGAKFCNECGSPLLSITCPNCGAVNRPNAKFCNECGSPLASSPENAPPPLPIQPQARGNQQPDAAPESSSTTSAEAENPWTTVDTEERRVVTILFADMMGSTAIADYMDAEEVRRLMSGYFATLAQPIHRHGGTIEKYIGDAVMAIFGLPVAHEDDPERAVRAGLEMLGALKRFNERRLADDPQAPAVQIRIGISTGEVVAASGAGDGGQFLITGDAVNVAARLQQQADPGTVLVGARTYRSTHGAIVYQPLSPLQVKGKPKPLRVWQALDAVESQAAPPTQHLRGIEGLPSPFIGRAPELALLDAMYERVIGEQRPHLITLLGVPGVGKSRLVREWMQRLRQQRASDADSSGQGSNLALEPPLWLEGRCPPYGAGITYWPLAEILRSFCGFIHEDSPEQAGERLLKKVQEVIADGQESENTAWLARQLGFSIGLKMGQGEEVRPSADSSEQRENLFRAWRIFFESLARRQPLLVFIDDIHWANEALLDLLEYLTQRVSNAPLLFLCPTRLDLLEKRPGWGGGRRNFTTLTLEPLSAEQSHELIDALLSPDGLPPALRNSILAKAEGNPFFVEEMIRMLIDLGTLVCKNDRWQVVDQDPGRTYSDLLSFSIPDSVQGVLAARIDLLSPTEKRVLQHAAVAGRAFWKGALADLAQEISPEALNLALESLIRKDFIAENEHPTGIMIERDVQYNFNHVLVRDVAYASVPRARRAREHARMAEWLERMAAGRVEGFIELLAYHYQQAIVAWAQTTSGQALARRPARAQAQADLRQKAIDYLIQAGNEALGKYAANQSVRHYTAALDLLHDQESDPSLRPHLHERLARAYFVLSDGDSCWEHYHQALDELRDAPALERAHLYQHLTMLGTRWRSWFKQPPELSLIRSYLDEGFALLKEQQEVMEMALLLAGEAFWYIQAYFSQQLDESAMERAIASAERAASIAERLNHPVYLSEVLDALSNVYGNVSDNRAFLEVQKRRLALVDRIKDRAEIYDIYFTASRAYSQLSDYPQALYWADAALKVAESMNSRRKLCGMLGNKVLIYFQWDRWAEVLHWGERLATLCEQYDLLNQSWPAPQGIMALAIVYYRTGQNERGDYYAQMAELAVPETDLRHEFIIGQLRIAQQRLEEAREIFQRLSIHYTAIERPQIQWRLAELAALLGDEARYDELAPTALALMERSGSRKGWADLIRTRGMVQSRRGASSAAAEDFRAALECYRQIGTRWEEALTLEALAAHLAQASDSAQNQEIPGLFENALTMYEELHAAQDVSRARSALERFGLKAAQDASL